MKFIHFFDMHGGGTLKLKPYNHIYIECLSVDEGKVIFYNRFLIDPDRISCSCCGSDYSIGEYDSLEKACEYERGKKSLSDYLSRKDVLVIYNSEIPENEKTGEIPQSGWYYKA